MITYEVKIKIDSGVEEEWLHWMKTAHVPLVIATGMIRSFQILKPQDGQPHTYLFHYHFDNQRDYESYIQTHTTKLRDHVLQKYPDVFEATRQVYQWI